MTKDSSYSRVHNPTLKQAYEHYALMAEAATDPKDRDQWRALADEVGRRLGLVDPEPSVQAELFDAP